MPFRSAMILVALALALLAAAGAGQTTFTIDLGPDLDPDGSAADGNLVYAISVPALTPPTLGTAADILGGPDYTGGPAGAVGSNLLDVNGSITIELPFGLRDLPGVDLIVFGAQLDEDEGWDLLVGSTSNVAAMTLVGSFAGSPAGQLNSESPLAVRVDFAGTVLPAGARFVHMVKNEPDVGAPSFGFDYDAVGVPPLAPFADLGGALAGSAGVPILVGASELLANGPLLLTLDNAAAAAPVTIVVGLSVVSLPFKGGTLVPSPDILVFGLSTDLSGSLDLLATWPVSVPSGLTFVFQYWITDSAGPSGFAATNAVAGTTP